MTTALYGIPNCDTVRRARAWLAERREDVVFHDVRRAGVEPERLAGWVGRLGWERVLNRRGTTWRAIDEAAKAGVVDAESAVQVMRDHPSAIRRPIVEWPDGGPTVGFDADDWSTRVGRR